jgi:ribosome-associated protein
MGINELIEHLKGELTFKTSRSGGKGGQNVNKVSSKVELDFNVMSSAFLSEEQKILLYKKLAARINKEGVLQVISQTDRSQLGNKEIAITIFKQLLQIAFKPEKKRKPTKPSKGAKEKRIETKKKHSEKKQLRRRDNF